MKQRILSLLLALALICSLLPVLPASADKATEYPLYIAGTKVTSDNAADVLDDGAFSYDAENNVLTVKGSCWAGNEPVINSFIADLTVHIAGKVELKSNTNVIYAHDDMTLTGGYTSFLHSSHVASIYTTADLTIKNASIHARGNAGSIASPGKNKAHLTIQNSYVLANDWQGTRAFCGFEKLTLDRCSITEPINARVEGGTVVNENGDICRQVEISRYYSLWIGDTQVGAYNAKDVLGDGAFSYDVDSNVLSVKKDYDAGSKIAIHNQTPGLRIHAEKNVTLSSDQAALLIKADTELGGAGRLTLDGDTDCVFVQNGATLTLDRADVDVSGGDGIMGVSASSGEKLVIRQSRLHASASGYAALFNFTDVVLDGCEITEPEGGKIQNGYAVDKNGAALKNVRIEPIDYHFIVCGEEVTSVNALDILGDGVFSYDDYSNTLTVRGDCSTGANVLVNNNPGLTLCVAEDSTLTAVGAGAILAFEDMTITGPGRLTLRSETTDPCCIVSYGAAVTIENAYVEANADLKGAVSTGTLIVRNSFVKLQNDGVVNGFAEIRLAACTVTEPVGAKVQDGSIVNSFGSLAKNVVIEAETYDLWIAGKRVDSINADDVLQDGAFSYDPAQKLLTVQDSCISEAPVIENKIEGLTLYVARDVALWSGVFTVKITADLTITGPGRLTAVSTTYSAIDVNPGADLTIRNADVYAEGKYGIMGEDVNRLTVENSFLHAVGSSGAIREFGEIRLGEGCVITAPSDARIDGGYVVDKDGAVCSDVTIQTLYPLWVAGTQVSCRNASDVLGAGGVSYDHEKKILSIFGGYSSETDNVIRSEIPGLTIYVLGDTFLKSTEPVILATADLTITGPGKLTLREGSSGVAVFDGAKLTLDGVRLETDSKVNYGLSGSNSGEQLVIQNSTLRVRGAVAAISFFGGVSLSNCEIVRPEGGKVSGGSVTEQDGKPAKDVMIETVNYRLWIAGKMLTGENKSDVLGDGAFCFDPAENTLTVSKSCDAGFQSVIYNRIPGLKLVAAEDVTLSCDAGNAISSDSDLTITGPGKLTLRSADTAIRVFGSGLLRIESAQIDAVGKYGMESDREPIIRGSSVHLTGTDGLALFRMTGMTLEGCEILSPEGCAFNGNMFLDSEGNLVPELTIGTVEYELWINGVQVTGANADDVLGDGVFSYNVGKNRLSVNGSFQTESNSVILNRVPDLTVYVAKEAKLQAADDAIQTTRDLTITGPDKLTLVSETSSGLYAMHGATVTLEGVTVDAAGKWGIAGDKNGEKLIIQNSTVLCEGDEAALCDFDGGVELEGCSLVNPAAGEIKDGMIVYASGSPARAIAIEKAFEEEYVNPFVDVIEGKYYYTPVLWAYYAEPQITNGMDATHFAPDGICTRGQIVTFLWRAKGCPAPSTTESPFADVTNPKAYYYQAVLWAVENGITAGMDPTHFAPDEGCTRGQVVTFLWRAEDKPAPAQSDNPFVDVESGKFYSEAVLWAYYHDPQITNGMDATHFAPDGTCTRGQIVTFLYRALAPKEDVK